MIITVNGVAINWEGSELTITDLLSRYKVEKPEMVSVQVNGAFVGKKDYGTKTVTNNDEVDFLYFMGGGKAS
ncbi:MAG: sulfur carrier protein ThiS [Deltaproteobacteria bacterium]|nr:sulfur carrier protein ThiS [Deltaproteobacteria bacterium]